MARVADGKGEGVKKGWTVLVAEEDVHPREPVAEALGKMGVNTIKARSTDEAWWLLLSDRKIDLALLDAAMPGSMNGVELARRLPALRGGLPVILMSGTRTDSSQGRSGLDVLQRPFDLDELALAVERGVHSRVCQTE